MISMQNNKKNMNFLMVHHRKMNLFLLLLVLLTSFSLACSSTTRIFSYLAINASNSAFNKTVICDFSCDHTCWGCSSRLQHMKLFPLRTWLGTSDLPVRRLKFLNHNDGPKKKNLIKMLHRTCKMIKALKQSRLK